MRDTPEDDLPDLLRKRVLRQRKRLKIVRFSFAITAVVSVLLLFAANQTQTLAPTARTIFIVPGTGGLWLIDQHLEITAEKDISDGTFALVRVDEDGITQGTRYEGLVRSVTAIDEHTIGVTTPSRFISIQTGEQQWPRGEIVSLGLNDSTASPVVVNYRDEPWLCWVRGSDIMVQPFGREQVEPKSVHQTAAPGAELQATVQGGLIWLSILATRSGDLTLISFTPGVEAAVGQSSAAPDRDADATGEPQAPAVLKTTVLREFSSDVTSNVRAVSFAVLDSAEGPRPVVAIQRKEEGNRAWQLMLWTRDEKSSKGSWQDAGPPPRAKPITGMELSNFVALRGERENLVAVYSEIGEVRTATATPEGSTLQWSESRLIPLDRTTGPTVYIVWITVLFVVVLVMASQGVWLLLNRERAMDKTLAELLETHEAVKKGETKSAALVFANPFARALALLLDIAITSPVIILLQGVYEYSWERAYGFLAIGTVTSFDADLLPAIQATVVTLVVLSIYGMCCELLWGRTFGKALFRLRVVNADGEAPDAWRIVVRNALKIVEMIHWAVLLIPMGLMMISGKQQRLGDLAAGTYVIVDVVPDETPDDIDI